MVVKLRLARKGRKHSAFYHLVAADARAPRDGRNLGKLGTYNPSKNPAPVDLNVPEILSWLEKGAQPTTTVRQILSSQGILLKRHLQMGVDKGVITQAMADKRFASWEKIAAKKRRKPYESITDQSTVQTNKEEKAVTKEAKPSSPTSTPQSDTKGATTPTEATQEPTTATEKSKDNEGASPIKEATPAPQEVQEKEATPSQKDAEKA
ncbi:MAG: 30S ribosomal protein S16 [Bacteroidota bacterium]